MKSLHVWTTALVLLFSSYLFAGGTVLEITRNLQMTARDPLPPKNYLIDVGSKEGVQVGEVLEVFRMVPTLNGIIGQPNQLLKVVVGELKIIALGESVSIARLEKQIDLFDMPVKGTNAILVGDQVIRKSSLPFQ